MLAPHTADALRHGVRVLAKPKTKYSIIDVCKCVVVVCWVIWFKKMILCLTIINLFFVFCFLFFADSIQDTH